jgi:hypothetical protein
MLAWKWDRTREVVHRVIDQTGEVLESPVVKISGEMSLYSSVDTHLDPSSHDLSAHTSCGKNMQATSEHVVRLSSTLNRYRTLICVRAYTLIVSSLQLS